MFRKIITSILKPYYNPSVTTESLKVTISSEGVKLDLESLMTNERVRKQMQEMSKLNITGR